MIIWINDVHIKYITSWTISLSRLSLFTAHYESSSDRTFRSGKLENRKLRILDGGRVIE